MANDEIGYQTEIIKEVNNNRGHAFKASNTVLKGVADLYIKFPCYNAYFVECKFLNFTEDMNYKTIKMTQPQHEFLVANSEAGGNVSFWTGFKYQSTNRTLWGTVVSDPIWNGPTVKITKEMLLYPEQYKNIFIKRKGEVWGVEWIIDFCSDYSRNEDANP